jgi:hypothetical protein
MHILYLYLSLKTISKDLKNNFKSSYLLQPHFSKLSGIHPQSVSIVQRATFNATRIQENIGYYFVNDDFDPRLRWWQKPVPVFKLISKLQPDIIQIHGLDLPLQFRWLRREVGHDIKLVGEHTGEKIWANRKLWLQQFGLRVADGFIFKDKKDAVPWTKASVILNKQPIIEIPTAVEDAESTADSLLMFYNDLLTGERKI